MQWEAEAWLLELQPATNVQWVARLVEGQLISEGLGDHRVALPTRLIVALTQDSKESVQRVWKHAELESDMQSDSL